MNLALPYGDPSKSCVDLYRICSHICFLYAIFAYKLHPYCLTRLRRFVRVVFRTFMIVQRFREHNGDRCRAESGAAKERRRIQSTEMRWGCTLLWCRGEWWEVREAKLFLSFSGRAFLRGNISTRQEHTGPFTISRIGTCARLHFGTSRTSSREKHRFTMISHRSRLWIVLKNEIIKELLAFGFLWHFYNKI